MVFVTVGTHEQQFNRLIESVDCLKKENKIEDKVIIQTGYSTYEPKYCQWSRLFSYQEMKNNVAEARIVITHGGPSSFIMPLQIGKIPIVIPRQQRFNEHVNNHQAEFCKKLSVRWGNIIVIEKLEELEPVLKDYEQIARKIDQKQGSNNERFCGAFSRLIEELCDMED